jgi:hypothetical protein
MILLKKHKRKIVLASTILVLLAPLLISNVSGQGGGALGLILRPEEGPGGLNVDVGLNIHKALADEGMPDGYADQYKGLHYSLVWDVGGRNTPPDLETVRTATWQVIGYATFNDNGVLSGVATIPNGATTGDHLICAIYSYQASDAPYEYWWGYFTVKSEEQLAALLPNWLLYLIIAIIGITVTLAVVLFLRTRRTRIPPP